MADDQVSKAGFSGFPTSFHNKRLIVCCDGTWVNSDNGYDDKTNTLQNPSNVTRFVRALLGGRKSSPFSPIQKTSDQITYYQAGVGSTGSFTNKFLGGFSGLGLDENIREAYAFIANNWSPGDEIFLLGFSRGAFTARSVAGMIGAVGLLSKLGMDQFYSVFKDYENMLRPKGEYKREKALNFGQPTLDVEGQQNYLDFLRNYKVDGVTMPLTCSEIPKIKAIGVWDTVGTLGIPPTMFFDNLTKRFGHAVVRDELKFYNTQLGPNIENAFQALALDEARYSFPPAVWENPFVGSPLGAQGCPNLKQVWFPGGHANIGGGMDDQQLSDITLAWMMDQMREFLDFDEDYIRHQFKVAVEKDTKANGAMKVWGCGDIKSNFTWYESLAYSISGYAPRSPGQYHQTDPKKGTQTSTLLQNTFERVHPSVRVRHVCPYGKDRDNKGSYTAKALTVHYWENMVEKISGVEAWKRAEKSAKTAAAAAAAVAEAVVAAAEDGLTEMEEEKLGYFEEALLVSREVVKGHCHKLVDGVIRCVDL